MTKQKKERKKQSSQSGKLSSDDIKHLENELKETKDKLLRALADVQNVQKRMEKELHTKEFEIKKKYLLELLDIYELLQKAQKDSNPQEGIKAILNAVNSFLQKEEVTAIDSCGKPFDYTCHHAVCTVEKTDAADNTVVEEVKKGYMINNKLLRPAHVVVAKKDEKEGEA